MSDSGSAGSFEVVIEPRSEDYYPDDERWRDQVTGLYDSVREHVDVSRVGSATAGTKGAVEELVIALGSAGVFTSAVECFRAWLKRDRGRSIDVRWNEDGVQRFVTLTGDAIDAESVREIANAAARRVGGPPWPASTEPS